MEETWVWVRSGRRNGLPAFIHYPKVWLKISNYSEGIKICFNVDRDDTISVVPPTATLGPRLVRLLYGSKIFTHRGLPPSEGPSFILSAPEVFSAGQIHLRNPIMSAKISSFPGTSGPNADFLLEKLQDPKVVESLLSLLEKSQMLNDFLERGETMLNSITKGVGEFGRVGATTLSKSLETVDLDDLKATGNNLKGMIPAIRDFVSELGSLKEAGFFDPDVVKIIGRAGRAMSAAARDPEAHSNESRGIFSMTGLLKDPEISRTLNFMISFARHFGGDLDKDGAGSAKK